MDKLPLIPLQTLAGNDVPHLNALQSLLFGHLEIIITFWWFVWFITLIVVIRYVLVYGNRDNASAERNDVHD